MSAADPTRITRGDLEAKLREVRGQVEQTGESAKSVGIIVAGVAAVAVVAVVFLMGRRRGRRKSTIVEIRRV